MSLSPLPLIIFDKYWSKAAMARRGPNKWNKEDSAMLIDLVQKNPAIWDTKSNESTDSSKKFADIWPEIAQQFGKDGKLQNYSTVKI